MIFETETLESQSKTQ